METKKCSKEGCEKEAGNHIFYDSTLCKEHAYDDEIENNREDCRFQTDKGSNK